MTDWKEQYLAALEARDEAEQVNVSLYDYCTKLANEKATLLQQAAEKVEQPVAPPPPQPLIGYGIPRFSSPTPVQEGTILAQFRQDLSKAQQERESLQQKLDEAVKELDALKTRVRIDSKKITQLTSNVQQLNIRLRDRDEEIKGKAKLVENVQDDNVTLNLQLNVAEEKADKLRKENQELVDRWMALKRDEAAKMNEEGKFE